MTIKAVKKRDIATGGVKKRGRARAETWVLGEEEGAAETCLSQVGGEQHDAETKQEKIPQRWCDLSEV